MLKDERHRAEPRHLRQHPCALRESYVDHTKWRVPYEQLQVDDIASMAINGSKFSWEGPCKLSSKWHFHRSILKIKPESNAVLHIHSTFCTVVSIARESIPAVYYMIGAFGGNNVECAEYATFGTALLSKNIKNAMQD